MSDGGNVRNVRIFGVHDDAADRLRFLQASFLKTLPTIDRLVHAGAERGALTIVRLTRADVNDVRVGRRDRDVSNRGDRIGIEDRHPCRPVIRAFPDSAGGKPEIDRAWIALDDSDVVDATAHVRRTNRSPDEGLQDGIVGLIDRRWKRRDRGGALCDEPSPRDKTHTNAEPGERAHAQNLSTHGFSPSLFLLAEIYFWSLPCFGGNFPIRMFFEAEHLGGDVRG